MGERGINDELALITPNAGSKYSFMLPLRFIPRMVLLSISEMLLVESVSDVSEVLFVWHNPTLSFIPEPTIHRWRPSPGFPSNADPRVASAFLNDLRSSGRLAYLRPVSRRLFRFRCTRTDEEYKIVETFHPFNHTKESTNWQESIRRRDDQDDPAQDPTEV